MRHSQRLDNKSNGVHFFKIILERSLQSGELMVPKSFVKNHWQGISTSVSLILPNKTKWKVYWMKRDGDVYFHNGWKEFAEYISLEVAQFVVFQYEGKSRFNVIVFGKSGIEIKYPSKDNNTLEECEEVHESDLVAEGKRGKPKPASPPYKKMKTSPKEEEHPSFYYAKHSNKFVAGSGNELKERSRALVEKLKLKHCDSQTFVQTIHKSYIGRDLLIIPNDFYNLNLYKMEGQMARLFVNKERTWDVELKLYSGGQIIFGRGWRTFLCDNNLKLGDVCAFVLNKSNGVLFQVFIYPLHEYPCHLPFQEGLSQRPSSLKIPDIIKDKSRLMSEDGFDIHIKPSMNGQACIPMTFIKKFLSEKDNGRFVTLRVGRNTWPVKVLYYKYCSSARFSLGWPEFVKECGLKAGDVCHFLMIDKKNLELQVTIN
ncbi:B3 domain-containing transcription factor VRN1-like isoform X3 [Lotus japonicus]|uniref:B3 domain-containing transcription factor VRN1-like isoform X3 n=1 Tax=Lotus japonicus TaxID=34305 RepID=UPI00258BB4D4|nr:B3 domain-containing transcription factor VRN1-like isoform X3 [Lotus japonicus]